MRLLQEGEWLNDAVISFFFEYLRREEFGELSRSVLLVPPDTAMLLHCLPPPQARSVLGGLIDASHDLVRSHYTLATPSGMCRAR